MAFSKCVEFIASGVKGAARPLSLGLVVLCFSVVSSRGVIITVSFSGTVQTGSGQMHAGDPYQLAVQYNTLTPGHSDYPGQSYYALLDTSLTTPGYSAFAQDGTVKIQNGNGNIGTVGGQDQFNLDAYHSGSFPQIESNFVFRSLVLQLLDWNGSMFDSDQLPTAIRTNQWNSYWFCRLTWWQGSDYRFVDLNTPSQIQVIPEPATGALVASFIVIPFLLLKKTRSSRGILSKDGTLLGNRRLRRCSSHSAANEEKSA